MRKNIDVSWPIDNRQCIVYYTIMTFEDYLMQVHDKQYHGTADDAPDDYQNWSNNMGADEFIQYAEEYKSIRIKEIDIEIDSVAHDYDFGDLNI